jgi:hypothetical protein
VVHVRHIPVMAEMSPWTIGPAKQNLDAIEADARRVSEDTLQGIGVDWEFVVRSGDPAHELMVTADDRSAAAIVVGGRPHKAAVSGLIGSIDAALVHRFHGSVLVVRGDDVEWHAPTDGEHHVALAPCEIRPAASGLHESEHAAGLARRPPVNLANKEP